MPGYRTLRWGHSQVSSAGFRRALTGGRRLRKLIAARIRLGPNAPREPLPATPILQHAQEGNDIGLLLRRQSRLSGVWMAGCGRAIMQSHSAEGAVWLAFRFTCL